MTRRRRTIAAILAVAGTLIGPVLGCAPPAPGPAAPATPPRPVSAAPTGRPEILGAERWTIPAGETDPIRLVLCRPVQAEIGLTDAQAVALDASLRDQIDALDAITLATATDAPPSFEPEAVARAYARSAEADLARRSGVAGVLDGRQGGRLRQIALQNAGVAALLRPEVAEAVGLSAEGSRAVAILVARKEARDADLTARYGFGPVRPPAPLPDEPPEWRAYREKAERASADFAANLAEAAKGIDALLTPAQRATLAGLLGPPFPLDKYREFDPDGEGPPATP